MHNLSPKFLIAHALPIRGLTHFSPSEHSGSASKGVNRIARVEKEQVMGKFHN